ncbi:hypothetical protein BD310DRAFT_52938 [Dichomitus squalens]|uniref:Uncharacterized protein n=1 Tax=Dichomitus squalens TaxID=114155 RepID=A0A4Q9Q5C9_9APHY|nr:hypothetical protein BD310DRAFT_52938 [Dichomitus squalens]
MRHFGPRIHCGAAKGGRDGSGTGSLMAIETGQRSLHQRMRGLPLENFIQQGRRLPLWGIREDQMNPSIVGCRLRALRDIPVRIHPRTSLLCGRRRQNDFRTGPAANKSQDRSCIRQRNWLARRNTDCHVSCQMRAQTAPVGCPTASTRVGVVAVTSQRPTRLVTPCPSHVDAETALAPFWRSMV